MFPIFDIILSISLFLQLDVLLFFSVFLHSNNELLLQNSHMRLSFVFFYCSRNHHGNVNKYNCENANLERSSDNILHFVIPTEIGEENHMVVEQHYHALVEKLHSISFVPDMRSDTSIPDDVGWTQKAEQLNLQIVIFVEQGRNDSKQSSPQHCYNDVVLAVLASVIMDICVHWFKLFLHDSRCNFLSVSSQKYCIQDWDQKDDNT